VARDVARYLGYPVHQVIENGVDTTTFAKAPKDLALAELRLPPGRKIALTVGGRDFRKGSDVFVTACKAAGWLPVAAGSRLDGAHNLGVLDSRRLALAYSCSDAVVFASRYEGASLAVLEALACGAVSLMTNVGSVPTLLERCSGLSRCLIDVSVPSVATKLREIAADPGEFSDIARSAEAMVRSSYSTQSFEHAWGELFDSSWLADDRRHFGAPVRRAEPMGSRCSPAAT
jgi:glycosyltransferase involved in cell wall biosynthesis